MKGEIFEAAAGPVSGPGQFVPMPLCAMNLPPRFTLIGFTIEVSFLILILAIIIIIIIIIIISSLIKQRSYDLGSSLTLNC